MILSNMYSHYLTKSSNEFLIEFMQVAVYA